MRQGERSILITGCSSGIGREAVRTLKGRGWRVLATARKAEDLKSLAEREGVEALALDYAAPESIAAAAEAALERTEGRLDALFNNGAYGQLGAVEDLETDVLRAQFEANFFGWHELTRRIIPAMRANGGGRIVQCSSVLGFISPPYKGAYNASKHALEALSDAMRLELKGAGIHVALIEPGPIATRFNEHAIAAFRRNIDIEGSAHRDLYRARLAHMEAGNPSRFRLGPEAVVAKLVHALESRRPKIRYHVTWATRLAALGRRGLPYRVQDMLLAGR